MLPEEQELARLTTEQDRLAEEVCAAELGLETERAEVRQFQRRYYESVGKYYAQLDALEAEIAHLQAASASAAAQRAGAQAEAPAATARAAQEAAAEAAAQARASAEEAGIAQTIAPAVTHSEEDKRRYRKACMLMHPDRATSEPERLRRTEYMARVNVAYDRGDQAEIARLVAQFGADPEAVAGHDVGAQMVKAIRRIAQLRRRLTEITNEASSLLEGGPAELHVLRQTVAQAEALGGDPLGELATTLLKQISERRITLEIIRAAQSEPTR